MLLPKRLREGKQSTSRVAPEVWRSGSMPEAHRMLYHWKTTTRQD